MATQTIVFTSAPPNPALAGNSYTVSVTSGGSGKPVVFSSKTPAICSISGRTVKLLAGGSCEVAANQAGGSGYLPAPEVLQTFNIYIGQVIKFTSNFPTHALVGSTYLVTATGGASGNPVTFTSLTSGICSVTGTAAKFLASGTCTIAANQNGNSTYAQAAQVTQGGKVR